MIEMNLAISEETHIPAQEVHDRKTDGASPNRAIVEIGEYITGRKEMCEAICKKFEGIHGSGDLLEKSIGGDGVPPDAHTIWDMR